MSENNNISPSSNQLNTQNVKHRPKSPQKSRFNPTKQSHVSKHSCSVSSIITVCINFLKVPYRERHGVDITPLSYVPGAKIEKYLGNLNFFFIRETTSIREVAIFTSVFSFVNSFFSGRWLKWFCS